jgi:hypothetical protein
MTCTGNAHSECVGRLNKSAVLTQANKWANEQTSFASLGGLGGWGTFADGIEASFFAGYYYVVEVFVFLPTLGSRFNLSVSI